MSYVVYLVRCRDDSLYCGITTDIHRRMNEHNTSVKGSKYVRARRPVVLVYQKKCKDRSTASQLEAKLKTWSKIQKEKIIVEYQRRVAKRQSIV